MKRSMNKSPLRRRCLNDAIEKLQELARNRALQVNEKLARAERLLAAI